MSDTTSMTSGPDEQARADLLERILSDGSPLMHALDLVAEAVAMTLEVPMALVSLIGRERNFIVAGGGSEGRYGTGAPITHSFCKNVVALQSSLVLEKTAIADIVADNPAVEDYGIAAYAGEPITVNGEVLGALCVVDHQPRPWTEHEVAVLRSMADLVQLLTEARLASEDRFGEQADEAEVARLRDQQQTARLKVFEAMANDQQTAQTLSRRLQHALLPKPSASTGRQVDVFYKPGSDHMMLGGDFIDTIQDDDALDFVIGDVTGHGPEAAALAISLRSAWHALRSVGTDMAKVVRVLDAQTAESSLYATVLLGRITADGTLSIISAGHPEPIAVGEGEGAAVSELSITAGPMLGLGLESSHWEANIQPLGNQTLLAYTDGLIEGRIHRSSERFGVKRLLDAITEFGPAPDALCDAATEANGGPLADDVAILRIYPS